MFEKIKSIFAKPHHVDTPTILQMEATECGAACVAMIYAYYGLWLPLEIVREECGVSRDGVNAANMLKAARSRGMEAKGKRWPLKRLYDQKFPFIIHWEFNHFIVIEGIDDKYAYLNDPAMGHRKVEIEDFRESYTGVSVVLTPTDNFQPSGHKYRVLKVIFQKLMKDRGPLYFVLLLSICLMVPRLATPAYSSVFMDDILSSANYDWMKTLLVFIGGTFVILALLTYLRLWLLTKWQTKITLAESSKFFWHVLHLPMKFFLQRSPNEVSSRVGFNESVASVITGPAATAAFDLVMAVFYLIVLLSYNVKLTIIGVACTSVNVLTFLFVRKKLLELSMQAQMESGKEYGVEINGFMMIETLKANGNEDDFFAKWAGYRTKALTAQQKMMRYNLLLQFAPLVAGGINTAMIMTIGGFAIMDGLMTTGIYMAFQGMLSGFTEPVNNLLGLGASLQNTEMELKRLEDVFNYPVDPLNFPGKEPEYSGKKRLSGAVCMDHVSFGYSKTKPPLISDFCLDLQPGGWVAFVGGSGSGKSTLAKILNATFEEWSGELRFDGILRRQIPHAVLCNSLSTVDQDIYLFEGTIRDNITLFDDSIRQRDVVQAAKDACIYDDINKMEGGFEHKVREGGGNFSGGQRQRLEIARALATNPSILILDEATSALDPVTELQVIENIRHRGCTCIVVAHRLSTIRDCDEIVVIDHGVVVERGRHTELMALGGIYATLVGDADKKKAGEAV